MVSLPRYFKRLLTRYLLVFLLLLDTTITIVTILHHSETKSTLLHFDEWGIVTLISALHLIVTAMLAALVFGARHPAQQSFRWRESSAIWMIMTVGFCFLAIDELLSVHEFIDISLHRTLGWQETPLSDRLDDLLLGLYALIGLGVLYVYREELHRYRQTRPFFAWGFALFFLSMALDTLINNGDNSDQLAIFLSPDMVVTVRFYLGAVEEFFKLLAATCFLTGVFAILQMARAQSSQKPSSKTPIYIKR